MQLQAEREELAAENEKMKKALGEQALEISILRDLVKKSQPSLADKVAIAHKWITAGYSVTIVLRIVGVSRSTYYYQQTHEPKPRTTSGGRPATQYTYTQDGEKVSDEQVKEWIMDAIEGDGFAYGYLKLTHWLRREHNLVINKKKVYRSVQGAWDSQASAKDQVRVPTETCQES